MKTLSEFSSKDFLVICVTSRTASGNEKFLIHIAVMESSCDVLYCIFTGSLVS